MQYRPARANGEGARRLFCSRWSCARGLGTAVPADARLDDLAFDAVGVGADRIEHGIHEDIGKQVRLEAQVEQFLVARIVVVVFRLHTGVWQMTDRDRESKLFGYALNGLGKFEHVEHLRELVEDPVLTQLRRVEDGEFHAAQRVTNVEEAARLTALAVNGQWDAGNRLHAEAVEGGAEDLVIVEAGGKGRVHP